MSTDKSASPTLPGHESYSYEYFTVGALPVRVKYDDKHRAMKAEYPDANSGQLQIDNMLLTPIEHKGEAQTIKEEIWDQKCAEIFKKKITPGFNPR